MNQLTTPTSMGHEASKKRLAARIGDAKSLRGFASLDPIEQRRIASAGGKASQASGQCHRWTKEEARTAGRKGGLISRRGSTPGQGPKKSILLA